MIAEYFIGKCILERTQIARRPIGSVIEICDIGQDDPAGSYLKILCYQIMLSVALMIVRCLPFIGILFGSILNI